MHSVGTVAAVRFVAAIRIAAALRAITTAVTPHDTALEGQSLEPAAGERRSVATNRVEFVVATGPADRRVIPNR